MCDDTLFVGFDGVALCLFPLEIKSGETDTAKNSKSWGQVANSVRFWGDYIGQNTFKSRLLQSVFGNLIFNQIDRRLASGDQPKLLELSRATQESSLWTKC